tara:strand:+ start:5171 stop:5869 length:699 start_codon:yes stop_codon:yes gene_type:complete
MSFVAAALSVGLGAYQAYQGSQAADDAALEAQKARAEMDKQKAEFAKLDTSNPYLNMENTMEDLTVNKQQAQFEAQENRQNQANVMQSMKGAAGSSGIAGLAQAMANEGSLATQKASASIGQQEAANQKASTAEASKIQTLEREGEIASRKMQMGKIDSLMGMAAGDVSNANAMQSAGQAQMMAGISGAVGGVGAIGAGISDARDANAGPSVGDTKTMLNGVAATWNGTAWV